MEVLHVFFKAKQGVGDQVNLSDGKVLEFTRPAKGLYIRVVLRGENRYDLSMVRGGGTCPKQAWYNRAEESWGHLSRHDIKERCEKQLHT